MQAAKEPQGHRAAASGPSKVIPEEFHRFDGILGAGLLELVLFEGSQALNLMGAAAEAKRSGNVMLDLFEIARSGKGPEFDKAMRNEFSEIDHSPSAGNGGLLFLAGIRFLKHLLDQRGDIIGKSVTVVIEVSPGSGLAIDGACVPLANVGEFPGEFRTGLDIRSSNDAVNADRDVASTGIIHLGPDLIHKANKVAE